MGSTRSYYFYTKADAEYILHILEQSVSDYKIITAYDVNQLCGAGSSSTDHYVGWTEPMIKDAKIEMAQYGYILSLPCPRSIKGLNSCTPTKSTTPEPLCITIHTKELDDVDATLAETFKYIYTIKDRMVNLTIM